MHDSSPPLAKVRRYSAAASTAVQEKNSSPRSHEVGDALGLSFSSSNVRGGLRVHASFSGLLLAAATLRRRFHVTTRRMNSKRLANVVEGVIN
ncbi:hypothetical protein OAO87_01310 [bacterium]|nr:hypothetical protein [bacterium]